MLWILSTSTWGQCPGELSCGTGPLKCVLGELNGFNCYTLDFTNRDHPSRNLCNSRKSASNVSWWTFIGEGGDVVIAITALRQNCRNGRGVRAGVMEGECKDENTMACDADCDSDFISLTFQTVPGELYFLWIDGCDGDYCNFSIRTLGSTARPVIPMPLPDIRINGDICPGATINITLPDLVSTCRTIIECTINDSLIGRGQFFQSTLPQDIDTITEMEICFSITIGSVNGQYVCQSETICTTLYLMPLLFDTVTHTICYGDSIMGILALQDTVLMDTLVNSNFKRIISHDIMLDSLTYSQIMIRTFQDSMIDGRYYANDTMLIDSFINDRGCDSTHKTIVDVSYRIIADTVFCDSIMLLDTLTIYRDTTIKTWVQNPLMDTLIQSMYHHERSHFSAVDTTLSKGDEYLGQVIFNDTMINENLISIHGCDSIITHEIGVLTTGSDQQKLRVEIYPNPIESGRYLHIKGQVASHHRMDVIDLHGRHLIKQERIKSNKIALSGAPGVYIVVLSNENNVMEYYKVLLVQ